MAKNKRYNFFIPHLTNQDEFTLFAAFENLEADKKLNANSI